MCVWKREPTLSGIRSNGKWLEQPKRNNLQSDISAFMIICRKHDQLKNSEEVELQAVVLVRCG